ncbi:hypothetical protein QR680_000421 [Steinernema hermaphroditum]|uniref:Uncharacterized protein n=1 Tax=Steinernema hermaphroditum TaxID=289476 RepID=A0AA39GUI9_9BILA|nr:hypothetical protein QR680_000421 [Steinernema hermaphroditum]
MPGTPNRASARSPKTPKSTGRPRRNPATVEASGAVGPSGLATVRRGRGRRATGMNSPSTENHSEEQRGEDVGQPTDQVVDEESVQPARSPPKRGRPRRNVETAEEQHVAQESAEGQQNAAQPEEQAQETTEAKKTRGRPRKQKAEDTVPEQSALTGSSSVEHGNEEAAPTRKGRRSSRLAKNSAPEDTPLPSGDATTPVSESANTEAISTPRTRSRGQASADTPAQVESSSEVESAVPSKKTRRTRSRLREGTDQPHESAAPHEDVVASETPAAPEAPQETEPPKNMTTNQDKQTAEPPAGQGCMEVDKSDEPTTLRRTTRSGGRSGTNASVATAEQLSKTPSKTDAQHAEPARRTTRSAAKREAPETTTEEARSKKAKKDDQPAETGRTSRAKKRGAVEEEETNPEPEVPTSPLVGILKKDNESKKTQPQDRTPSDNVVGAQENPPAFEEEQQTEPSRNTRKRSQKVNTAALSGDGPAGPTRRSQTAAASEAVGVDADAEMTEQSLPAVAEVPPAAEESIGEHPDTQATPKEAKHVHFTDDSAGGPSTRTRRSQAGAGEAEKHSEEPDKPATSKGSATKKGRGGQQKDAGDAPKDGPARRTRRSQATADEEPLQPSEPTPKRRTRRTQEAAAEQEQARAEEVVAAITDESQPTEVHQEGNESQPTGGDESNVATPGRTRRSQRVAESAQSPAHQSQLSGTEEKLEQTASSGNVDDTEEEPLQPSEPIPKRRTRRTQEAAAEQEQARAEEVVAAITDESQPTEVHQEGNESQPTGGDESNVATPGRTRRSQRVAESAQSPAHQSQLSGTEEKLEQTASSGNVDDTEEEPLQPSEPIPKRRTRRTQEAAAEQEQARAEEVAAAITEESQPTEVHQEVNESQPTGGDESKVATPRRTRRSQRVADSTQPPAHQSQPSEPEENLEQTASSGNVDDTAEEPPSADNRPEENESAKADHDQPTEAPVRRSRRGRKSAEEGTLSRPAGRRTRRSQAANSVQEEEANEDSAADFQPQEQDDELSTTVPQRRTSRTRHSQDVTTLANEESIAVDNEAADSQARHEAETVGEAPVGDELPLSENPVAENNSTKADTDESKEEAVLTEEVPTSQPQEPLTEERSPQSSVEEKVLDAANHGDPSEAGESGTNESRPGEKLSVKDNAEEPSEGSERQPLGGEKAADHKTTSKPQGSSATERITRNQATAPVQREQSNEEPSPFPAFARRKQQNASNTMRSPQWPTSTTPRVQPFFFAPVEQVFQPPTGHVGVREEPVEVFVPGPDEFLQQDFEIIIAIPREEPGSPKEEEPKVVRRCQHAHCHAEEEPVWEQLRTPNVTSASRSQATASVKTEEVNEEHASSSGLGTSKQNTKQNKSAPSKRSTRKRGELVWNDVFARLNQEIADGNLETIAPEEAASQPSSNEVPRSATEPLTANSQVEQTDSQKVDGKTGQSNTASDDTSSQIQETPSQTTQSQVAHSVQEEEVKNDSASDPALQKPTRKDEPSADEPIDFSTERQREENKNPTVVGKMAPGVDNETKANQMENESAKREQPVEDNAQSAGSQLADRTKVEVTEGGDPNGPVQISDGDNETSTPSGTTESGEPTEAIPDSEEKSPREDTAPEPLPEAIVSQNEPIVDESNGHAAAEGTKAAEKTDTNAVGDSTGSATAHANEGRQGRARRKVQRFSPPLEAPTRRKSRSTGRVSDCQEEVKPRPAPQPEPVPNREPHQDRAVTDALHEGAADAPAEDGKVQSVIIPEMRAAPPLPGRVDPLLGPESQISPEIFPTHSTRPIRSGGGGVQLLSSSAPHVVFNLKQNLVQPRDVNKDLSDDEDNQPIAMADGRPHLHAPTVQHAIAGGVEAVVQHPPPEQESAEEAATSEQSSPADNESQEPVGARENEGEVIAEGVVEEAQAQRPEVQPNVVGSQGEVQIPQQAEPNPDDMQRAGQGEPNQAVKPNPAERDPEHRSDISDTDEDEEAAPSSSSRAGTSARAALASGSSSTSSMSSMSTDRSRRRRDAEQINRVTLECFDADRARAMEEQEQQAAAAAEPNALGSDEPQSLEMEPEQPQPISPASDDSVSGDEGRQEPQAPERQEPTAEPDANQPVVAPSAPQEPAAQNAEPEPAALPDATHSASGQSETSGRQEAGPSSANPRSSLSTGEQRVKQEDKPQQDDKKPPAKQIPASASSSAQEGGERDTAKKVVVKKEDEECSFGSVSSVSSVTTSEEDVAGTEKRPGGAQPAQATSSEQVTATVAATSQPPAKGEAKAAQDSKTAQGSGATSAAQAPSSGKGRHTGSKKKPQRGAMPDERSATSTGRPSLPIPGASEKPGPSGIKRSAPSSTSSKSAPAKAARLSKKTPGPSASAGTPRGAARSDNSRPSVVDRNRPSAVQPISLPSSPSVPSPNVLPPSPEIEYIGTRRSRGWWEEGEEGDDMYDVAPAARNIAGMVPDARDMDVAPDAGDMDDMAPDLPSPGPSTSSHFYPAQAVSRNELPSIYEPPVQPQRERRSAFDPPARSLHQAPFNIPRPVAPSQLHSRPIARPGNLAPQPQLPTARSSVFRPPVVNPTRHGADVADASNRLPSIRPRLSTIIGGQPRAASSRHPQPSGSLSMNGVQHNAGSSQLAAQQLLRLSGQSQARGQPSQLPIYQEPIDLLQFAQALNRQPPRVAQPAVPTNNRPSQPSGTPRAGSRAARPPHPPAPDQPKRPNSKK